MADTEKAQRRKTLLDAADRLTSIKVPRGPMVITTYRVQPDQEDRFLGLLDRKYELYRQNNIIGEEPVQLFRSADGGAPTIIEMFSWSEESEGWQSAQAVPEICTLWDEMDETLLAEFVIGVQPLPSRKAS